MSAQALTLISLNIEHDHHLNEVIAFFKAKNPDVLILQEIFEEDLPLFEAELGMRSVSTGLNYLTGTSRTLPKLCIATLSRLPIVSQQIFYYRGSPEALPTISPVHEADKMARALLIIEVEKEGVRYCTVNTHFTWSANATPSQDQHDDLNKILPVLEKIPGFVMCGDFNAPRGSIIFDTLSNLYKDNIPQTVTTTIDKTLHKAGDLNIVVDGLFTTANYQADDVQVIGGVSDHCAILARVKVVVEVASGNESH